MRMRENYFDRSPIYELATRDGKELTVMRGSGRDDVYVMVGEAGTGVDMSELVELAKALGLTSNAEDKARTLRAGIKASLTEIADAGGSTYWAREALKKIKSHLTRALEMAEDAPKLPTAPGSGITAKRITLSSAGPIEFRRIKDGRWVSELGVFTEAELLKAFDVVEVLA